MIRVDAELLRKALAQAEGDISQIERAPIPEDVTAWLRKNIPLASLVEFIEEEQWVESCQLCASYFNSAAEIMKWTNEYETLGTRFIVLGSAPNGDFIVVPRLKFDSIGFVSHEEFGYDETDLVKYIPVSQSVGELYYNSWNVEEYPCDYYDAEDSTNAQET